MTRDVVYEEWSAFMWRDGDWKQVGTPGNLAHASQELQDWKRDVPDGRFRLGNRGLNPWTLEAEEWNER